MDKDFYTIVEFAEKLRVHPNTVRNMIKSLRLSALKMSTGKRSAYRIPATEIERIALISLKESVLVFFNKKDC